MSSEPPRIDCLACRRPQALCVCRHIQPVDNRTPITVIQHPRERKHPFNTARLARLALNRIQLEVAWDIAMDRPELPPGAALLYPSESAIELGTIPVGDRPSHLVVLDGTWPQARSLYRNNEWMRALPHVSLSPAQPSDYRIRREPAQHCLSTIESIAAALEVCEPDNPDLKHLLTGFTAIIDGQIRRETGQPQPRRAERSRVSQTALLRDRWEDVVIVYAETTPPRCAVDSDQLEVVQLTAYRPATGETFDRMARVVAFPDACQLDMMQLNADDLRQAGPFGDLAEEWASFRADTDLYASWSWAASEVALHRLGETTSVMRLKAIYCNFYRRPAGRPDQVLAREGLEAEQVPLRGRAGFRVGNATSLARWLGAKAH
jgi:DTW domain-containing protein